MACPHFITRTAGCFILATYVAPLKPAPQGLINCKNLIKHLSDAKDPAFLCIYHKVELNRNSPISLEDRMFQGNLFT